MINCPDGSKIIEWQYPDEALNRILGASSYTTDKQPGQCDTSYLIKGRAPYNGLGYCGADYQTDPTPIYPFSARIQGKFKGLKRTLFENRTKYGTNPNGSCNPFVRSGTIDFWYSYIDYEGLEDPYRNGTGLIYFYDNWRETFDRGELIVIDSIERSDGLADDCGDCTFTIYSNEAVVYQQINESCPTVDEYCDNKCPPNTCEVECGNLICCYDSNGKAIKKFSK